ncbi:MAG: tol-pal system protein YbgF [Alphaproteobacteria bacterium]|nr:tol-pal system protein YbgF [Alphaproteobacteria bacterium]
MNARSTLLAFTALLALCTQGGFALAQQAEDILGASPNNAPVAAAPVMDAPPVQIAQTGAYEATLDTRINGIERQMQELTGQIERQGHELGQLTQRLDKFMADVEMRLQGNSNAPAATNTEPAPATSPPVPTNDANAPADPNNPTVKTLGTLPETSLNTAPAPAANAVGGGADAAYEQAFSLVKSGDYAGAQNGFEGFLKQYPDHALASNASYWLGETYFARSDYKRAAKIFAQTFQKYPKGSKSADSLLKLASSFEKMGNNKDACTTLNHLKKEFPAGDAALLRRAEQDLVRLGC